MTKTTPFLNSVIQALPTYVLAGLAVWATFFSSLPEVLHTQLRSEISEAKEHIRDLRRTKNSLEQEISEIRSERDILSSAVSEMRLNQHDLQEQTGILQSENERLVDNQNSLEQDISALINEKNVLTANIIDLQTQRAQYADAAVDTVKSKMAVTAYYWLSLHEYFVNIGVDYGKHREWLNACHELEALRPKYDALEFQEQHGDTNQLAVRFRELREYIGYSPPEFWGGFPNEPILEPRDGSTVLVFGSHTAKFLDLIRKDSCIASHNYLINFFFDNTVTERGVVPQTGADFIDDLKNEKFFDNLLVEERREIFDLLDRFVEQNSKFRTERINLTFDAEPTAAQIPIAAVEIKRNLQIFQQKIEMLMARIENGENRFSLE